MSRWAEMVSTAAIPSTWRMLAVRHGLNQRECVISAVMPPFPPEQLGIPTPQGGSAGFLRAVASAARLLSSSKIACGRSRAQKKSSEPSPKRTIGVYAGTGLMYQWRPSGEYACQRIILCAMKFSHAPRFARQFSSRMRYAQLQTEIWLMATLT